MIVATTIYLITIKNRSDFEDLVTYLVFIQMVIMALTIIPTELKLKKIFTKTGQRRQRDNSQLAGMEIGFMGISGLCCLNIYQYNN